MSLSAIHQRVQQFGAALKKLRKEKGLTQEALWDITGVSTSHISNIENAKTNPSLEMILMFADALEVSPAEFFSFW